MNSSHFYGLPNFWRGVVARKGKKFDYHENMTPKYDYSKYITNKFDSPNMFLSIPMRYFVVPNGRIIYACKVQGQNMTSSHIL